jgi:hypothetical protein
MKTTKTIKNGWTGEVKTAHTAGRCIVCKSLMWVFTDTGSSGDPRGPIKPKQNYNPLVASEYDRTGPDVPMCFDCGNTQSSYEIGLSRAYEIWNKDD